MANINDNYTFSADTGVISRLDDNPNESDLDAAGLKAAFDAGATNVVTQINSDLIPAINNRCDEVAEAASTSIGTVSSNLDTVSTNLGNISNLTTTDKTSAVNAINEVKASVPKVARGTTAVTTVGANNHKDISINYSSAGFTASPTIIATLKGNSDSYVHGNTAVGVVYDTVTTTGAKLRYYNSNNSSVTMYVSWIAIGE